MLPLNTTATFYKLLAGIEPALSSMATRRVTRLHHSNKLSRMSAGGLEPPASSSANWRSVRAELRGPVLSKPPARIELASFPYQGNALPAKLQRHLSNKKAPEAFASGAFHLAVTSSGSPGSAPSAHTVITGCTCRPQSQCKRISHDITVYLTNAPASSGFFVMPTDSSSTPCRPASWSPPPKDTSPPSRSAWTTGRGFCASGCRRR